MSIHLRRWGTVIGLIAAFTLPRPITEAQTALPQPQPETVPAAAAAASAAPAADTAAQEVLTLKITAYTSLPDETDDTPFITADGSYVHDGIVATNLLPFGTKVMIPSLFGDKVFTVDDRMSKKLMNNMDIWMGTWTAAIRFGAHVADVVVLPANADTASAKTASGAAAASSVTDAVSMASTALANGAMAMATGSKLPGPSVRQL